MAFVKCIDFYCYGQ